MPLIKNLTQINALENQDLFDNYMRKREEIEYLNNISTHDNLDEVDDILIIDNNKDKINKKKTKSNNYGNNMNNNSYGLNKDFINRKKSIGLKVKRFISKKKELISNY